MAKSFFNVANSFFRCVRSFQSVASALNVHVLANIKVGNIIIIGGIFIFLCGKDIIIGNIFMSSPKPTLSNTCLALSCLHLPQECPTYDLEWLASPIRA